MKQFELSLYSSFDKHRFTEAQKVNTVMLSWIKRHTVV